MIRDILINLSIIEVGKCDSYSMILIIDISLTWPDNTTSNSRTNGTSAKVFKLMNDDCPVKDTVWISIFHVDN